jgi:hypothetical protein
LVSPKDFGTGPREAKYKAYRDSLEAQTGKEVSGTSMDTPVSPAARQLQLDKFEKGRTEGWGSIQDGHPWNDSAEFDIAHQVRVEDMQCVAAKDQQQVDDIKKHLEMLLAAGHVSRIPEVILASDWSKHIILK